jgi:putative ABC transport system permease protein
MFNTMTIALLERTRDIGIMKAIGVYNLDIGKIFLTESVIIAGLGGVIGTVGGAGVGYGLNFLVNLLAKSVGSESQSMFYVPIWFAGGIVGFSIIVGLLTGLYPSKRAVKLNPLDALRYE